MAVMTRTKQPLQVNGVGAVARIEQLKRLIQHRRFCGIPEIEEQLHMDRQIYIEAAVLLAKRANYSENRVFRLGHDINRQFETYLTPAFANKVIEISYECDTSDIDIDKWIIDLDVTEDEYSEMLGTLANE